MKVDHTRVDVATRYDPILPDFDWFNWRAKEMWRTHGVLEYERCLEARNHMFRWAEYGVAELSWADDGGAFA